ncbi:hypothetical protein [Aestuariirhabdus haliotis]|uniref:hypothetical protein n=1 Tax=Aestuariirhabdus haliotis TaxID=2918751 RepID=UPI0020BEE026|nr:hypothetical protein [Aestuariirhabdus haliotis]MCL6418370.1 hypothetical protein [Aestuariirhabdus haliotis]
MLSGTIISHINLKEQTAIAIQKLSGNHLSIQQYLMESGLRFSSQKVEQHFIFALFFKRLKESNATFLRVLNPVQLSLLKG